MQLYPLNLGISKPNPIHQDHANPGFKKQVEIWKRMEGEIYLKRIINTLHEYNPWSIRFYKLETSATVV